MGADLRAARRRWGFVLVGAVVAVVLVMGVGPPGVFLPRVTVCQLGPLVGTYAIWTPDTPLNKPEGVNVSALVVNGGWNFTFSSGSLTVGAIHPSGDTGGGWGDYGPSFGVSMQGTLNNWSFYLVDNSSVIGSVSNPCTQEYVAEMGLPPYSDCGGLVTLPLENNTSDAVQPHVWDGKLGPNDSGSEPPSCPGATPGAYVWFDTSFHPNATGASAPVRWNLCNQIGTAQLYVPGVAEVPVTVYAPYAGYEISASGFETWTGSAQSVADLPVIIYTATYGVPEGWTWLLAPVGPTSVPINPDAPLPSLVAFEQEAC